MRNSLSETETNFYENPFQESPFKQDDNGQVDGLAYQAVVDGQREDPIGGNRAEDRQTSSKADFIFILFPGGREERGGGREGEGDRRQVETTSAVAVEDTAGHVAQVAQPAAERRRKGSRVFPTFQARNY